VNWRQWELADLFKNPENLPAFLAMSLPDLPVELRLHLFELFHPVNRLIDFWCGHPNQAHSFREVYEWTQSDWQQVRVYLHPQLRTPQLKNDLVNAITNHKVFEISRYVSLPTRVPITVDSMMAASLLPLWETDLPQSVMCLVERWLKLRPLHPITLEQAKPEKAFEEVKELLSSLEVFLYILFERLV